jgi:hypothetical protein
MKNSNFLFLLFIFLGIHHAKSQQNFTLYNMPSIPQSNLLNPALTPDCKWHLGIPALNSTYLHFTNSAFNFNKVFDALEPTNNDSSSTLNLNKLLDVFSPNNYIALKTEISWLNFGIKIKKKHYFQFSAQEKINLRLSLPKDLFRFIIDGNGGNNLGETFNFDFKVTALHYREFALGYAYNLTENITLGARLKYLQGNNIIDTKNALVTLKTNKNDFAYDVGAKLDIRASTPIGNPFAKDTSKNKTGPTFSDFFNTGNNGFGIDLGVQMKINEKLSVNASIIDLGFIHWQKNTFFAQSHDPNATYRFDGVHITSKDTSSDFGQYVSAVGDSLAKIFKIDNGTNKSFNSALFAEFFIGANYVLSKRFVAGGLIYGSFFNKKFYPGLTLNMNYKLGRALSLNFSNTIFNRGWLNPGLGVSVNAGAAQFYSVMDNFLFPVMVNSFRSFSWRFGMNLTFGRERLIPETPRTDPAQTDPGSL